MSEAIELTGEGNFCWNEQNISNQLYELGEVFLEPALLRKVYLLKEEFSHISVQAREEVIVELGNLLQQHRISVKQPEVPIDIEEAELVKIVLLVDRLQADAIEERLSGHDVAERT